MGGTHRPPPVDLRRSVHRPRRSRDRLRRLSGHTGTNRVLGGGTAGFGRGTDGRVRTGQAELVVVTAGRRGQEIGQLLIERVVSEAASRGHEDLAIRRPAARNISTIREFYDAGFRTRPGFRLRPQELEPGALPETAAALSGPMVPVTVADGGRVPSRSGPPGRHGACHPAAGVDAAVSAARPRDPRPRPGPP